MIDFKKLFRELDEMSPAQATQMIRTALDTSGVSYDVGEGEFVFTSLLRSGFAVEDSISIAFSTGNARRFNFSENTKPLNTNKYSSIDFDNEATKNYAVNKAIPAA